MIDASVRWRWIQASIVVGTIVLAFVLILPAVQMSREAERRTQSRNNLKQLGLALQNYHDTFRCFPPGGTFDSVGHGRHGWGILLWPYLDSSPLYSVIDFKQPCDAPYNAGCFQIKVPVLLNPSIRDPLPDHGFAITHYSANSNLLAANSTVPQSDIENAGNTFIMGELGGDFVPWGCPYNWRPHIGLTNTPRTYGRPENFGGQFVMVDTSVRWVSADVSDQVLSSLRGPNLAGAAGDNLTIVRPNSFPYPADARRIPSIRNHYD